MLVPSGLSLERLKLFLVFPSRQLDEALDVFGFQHAAESVLAEPATVRFYFVLSPSQFKTELSGVI